MNREEQRKLRELNKALPKIARDKIKKYKLKKKDYMIWYNKEELFFDLFFDVRISRDGHCVCTTIEKIKPLWLDDLLWDFLNMENNKEEPLSLRAIGAFTVNGSVMFKDSCELKNWEICELEKCIETYIYHFYQSIQSATIDDFIDNIDSSPYHKELRRALTFIHNQEYFEALNYLKEFDDGVFKNEGISINEAIRIYCKNKLNKNR